MQSLPEKSVQCCVTSPPYFGLRDYGHVGQIGLESTPDEFVSKMVEVFREVHRVLKDDGTLWLNLGDSYAGKGGCGAQMGQMKDRAYGKAARSSRFCGGGLKEKDLIGIPWRVAFALQADGWYLRQDIVWSKPNPMPESVRDRCTKAHEYLFLLSKGQRYYFDNDAIQESSAKPRSPGNIHPVRRLPNERGGENHNLRGSLHNIGPKETRNRRSVWTVATRPYSGAHFATFPLELVRPCVLAGSHPGDTVLDCFGGSGTAGLVAVQEGRRAALCELNPEYVTLAERRIAHAIYGEWSV